MKIVFPKTDCKIRPEDKTQQISVCFIPRKADDRVHHLHYIYYTNSLHWDSSIAKVKLKFPHLG